jgi:hypothetical protein
MIISREPVVRSEGKPINRLNKRSHSRHPPTVGAIRTAGVSSAINKLVGPAAVSNAASTRVSFQGVIIRVDLNYHFN